MATLKIRTATDLVNYFDQEPLLNLPEPRQHYDEDDDRQYLALVTTQQEQKAHELAALEEELDPETLEPLGVDELIDRQEATSSERWDRVYGRDATDFGNYLDFIRSH